MSDTIVPRILHEAAAREYLGGVAPGKVMPPVKIGGRNCWDRVALDQKLDELFGVIRTAPHKLSESRSALERWREQKRAEADDRAMDRALGQSEE
jgi:hypothetical protein